MWFWINRGRRTVGKRYDSKALSDIFILYGQNMRSILIKDELGNKLWISAMLMWKRGSDSKKKSYVKWSWSQSNYSEQFSYGKTVSDSRLFSYGKKALSSSNFPLGNRPCSYGKDALIPKNGIPIKVIFLWKVGSDSKPSFHGK